jgi:ribosomal protein S12 methylthiotransferase accessory factor YcaO
MAAGLAAGIAMRTDADAAVLRAVETSLAQGRRVLLQIMDSSKLG